ncbi:hypothetical protein [uncultured Nitrospira sp.]|uniref:hypothetical protein n=1 Tax=uncultured Nitrospira sp. TaxID=157176 RepID=UPI00314059D6
MKGKKAQVMEKNIAVFSKIERWVDHVQRWGFSFLIGIVSTGICPVSAEVLMTTDFESGNLSGWTVFSTSNGTLGGKGFPAVSLCNHGTPFSPSHCLQVQVGQLHFDPTGELQQGGGIGLTTMTNSGLIQLSARVGVTYHSPDYKRNLNGGLFEWVVDDQVIADLDVGPVDDGGTVQQLFSGKVSVAAGRHTIQLRVTRPFQSGAGKPAPVQFVDDVMVELLPQP